MSGRRASSELTREPQIVKFCTTLSSTVLVDVAKKRGWKETHEDGDWDIFLADVHSLTPEAGFEFGKLLERQRVNHFPRHVELTRKDLLTKNLKRAKRQLDKEGRGEELDFFPKTFTLPQEYGPFTDEFRKTGGVWIMKPCGRAQGKGIFLLDKLSLAGKWRREIEDKERIETYRDVYVAAKYIERPFLINELKFDIRLYVLVLSFTPLRVYLYRDGFCRFCSEKYTSSKEALMDLSVHLTNVAVQKRQRSCDASTALKWPLRQLRLYLITQFGRQRSDAVFQAIQRVVIRSLLTVQHVVTQDKHCFEIYGYDILLDRDLKPWLIEVNASPSLQTDSLEDQKRKQNMVHDALTLVDIENRYQGRLPATTGGFDAIYDHRREIQIHPATASLLAVPAESRQYDIKRLSFVLKVVEMDSDESRSARLKALREAKRLLEDEQASDASKPILRFRNYELRDSSIEHVKLAQAQPPLEVFDAETPAPPEHLTEDVLDVAPKKLNYDLKRDVEAKLELLERRTQRALVALQQAEERRRLEQQGGIADATESLSAPDSDSDVGS